MKKIELTNEEDLTYEPKGIYEKILDAYKQAIREDIKANAIVINKNLVKVPSHWANIMGRYIEIPTMICGLECYFVEDELPDNYSFAILEANKTQLDRIKEQAQIDATKNFLFKVESFYGYEDKDERKTIFEFLEDLKEIAKENGVEF